MYLINKISSLIVEVTDRCNSRCSHCSYWTNGPSNDFLEPNYYYEFITSLRRIGLSNVTLTGGEPLLHPELLTFIEFARKNDCKTKILTNGILLQNQSSNFFDSVEEIVISLDADNPELYFKIRGVNEFKSLINSIRMITENYTSLRLRCSFLVQKRNYMNLLPFLHLIKDLNVHSVAILFPNSFGDFNNKVDLFTYKNTILMDELDVQDFEQNVVPELKTFMCNHSKFVNWNINQIENIIQYLKFLAGMSSGTEFRKNKCLLPFETLVILSNNILKPCFFLPIEIKNLDLERDILNDLLYLKHQYIFNNQYFRNICNKCFEAPF